MASGRSLSDYGTSGNFDYFDLVDQSPSHGRCASFKGLLGDFLFHYQPIITGSDVCYIRMGYREQIFVKAGTLINTEYLKDESQHFLYSMFLEHFKKRDNKRGFMTVVDKRKNEAYYICVDTKRGGICNIDAGIDLTTKLLMINFKKERFDFGWTCNGKECDGDLGCYRVEGVTNKSQEPEVGCVSDIPSLVEQKPELGFLMRCYQTEPDQGCIAAGNEATKELFISCCCRFACQDGIYDKRSFWIIPSKSF
ncbi:hypothetical protein L596_014111 [Steinernema carpocapsae]|uniref:Uncharacterized protein n=2 Tax=Steinernema carpocapsae TaxID=34508 RepID=A0A4U5NBS1_STECR|nr:hypothetical protein L596_014111 [Steinernema carpocapsae]